MQIILNKIIHKSGLSNIASTSNYPLCIADWHLVLEHPIISVHTNLLFCPWCQRQRLWFLKFFYILIYSWVNWRRNVLTTLINKKHLMWPCLLFFPTLTNGDRIWSRTNTLDRYYHFPSPPHQIFHSSSVYCYHCNHYILCFSVILRCLLTVDKMVNGDKSSAV